MLSYKKVVTAFKIVVIAFQKVVTTFLPFSISYSVVYMDLLAKRYVLVQFDRLTGASK